MAFMTATTTQVGEGGFNERSNKNKRRGKNQHRGKDTDSGVAQEHDQTNNNVWQAPASDHQSWNKQPDVQNASDPWVKVENFVNSAQPYIDEFPGILGWNWEDEVVSRVVQLKRGRKHYLRGKEIGSGGFASVYKVLRKSDSRVFAGKSVKKACWKGKLLEEQEKMLRFQHGHILQYIDYFGDDNFEACLLLTEFCAGGNLWDHLNAVTRLSPDQVFRVTKQIASALEYMHAENFMHADVKPRNIMIRSLNPINVVLGDLADIIELPNAFGCLAGTKLFYAPEVVADKQNMSPAEDIWALGVSTLNMVGLTPRVMVMKSGLKDMRNLDEYPRQCWELVGDLIQLNPGNGIVNLLERMLTWDADERITAKALGQLIDKVQAIWGDQRMLGIEAPTDFMPVEFW